MKRPLKVAGWSGIAIVVVAAIIWIFQYLVGTNTSFNLVAGIVNMILTSLFLYGFVVLGKKFNSIMLLIMAWIGIVLAVGFSLIGIVQNVGAQGLGAGNTLDYGVILIYVIVSIIFGAYSILFGVGLLKIGGKVEKARTNGILEIVAGATMIIVVGWFIKLVAFFFEIAVLLKASKKLEK